MAFGLKLSAIAFLVIPFGGWQKNCSNLTEIRRVRQSVMCGRSVWPYTSVFFSLDSVTMLIAMTRNSWLDNIPFIISDLKVMRYWPLSEGSYRYYLPVSTTPGTRMRRTFYGTFVTHVGKKTRSRDLVCELLHTRCLFLKTQLLSYLRRCVVYAFASRSILKRYRVIISILEKSWNRVRFLDLPLVKIRYRIA